MLDIRALSLPYLFVGLLAACSGGDPAGGDDSATETSTSGDDTETGEGSETTGGACGLLGDACSAGECCDDLECSGDPAICDLAGGETDEGVFIGFDDGGPAIGICDPGTQDCPEGEKCTAYVMTPGYCCVDANKCVEIIGKKQSGDACDRGTDNDDCDKGLFCMTKTSGDTGLGLCIPFCDINNAASCTDAGLPDAKCIAFNDGILPLCEEECDPLLQDCSDMKQGCYAVGAQGFICTLPGYDDGKGNEGDECYTIQSCKPGMLCLSGDTQAGCMSDACCGLFCDASGDGAECTDPMEDCLPYFEMGMAPPGYEDVGVCGIPQ